MARRIQRPAVARLLGFPLVVMMAVSCTYGGRTTPPATSSPSPAPTPTTLPAPPSTPSKYGTDMASCAKLSCEVDVTTSEVIPLTSENVNLKIKLVNYHSSAVDFAILYPNGRSSEFTIDRARIPPYLFKYYSNTNMTVTVRGINPSGLATVRICKGSPPGTVSGQPCPD